MSLIAYRLLLFINIVLRVQSNRNVFSKHSKSILLFNAQEAHSIPLGYTVHIHIKIGRKSLLSCEMENETHT